jgi:cephalosporin-C deacetylase
MGLAGEPKDMYYTELFQHTCLMVRLALALDALDSAHICANGASQGGALSLVCAALNAPYIKKCASLYPFLADYRRAWDMDRDAIVFNGMKYCTRWFDPTGANLDAMFTQLGYIDVLNFVQRITCPVLFGTGLRDVVIPPSAQFAVYRRIQAPKQHLIYPDYGHEEIADFDDRLLRFFRREDD